ncbi:hypothetical protein AAC387_Pa03g2147 [Persea americana]
MEIFVEREGGLFGADGEQQTVWMSHGHGVAHLPHGFHVAARSGHGALAAIEWRERRLYGLQYHPEVTHSPEGMETLSRFLFNICGLTTNWKIQDLIQEHIKVITNMVGPEDHVICAFSGGIASTITTTLVHRTIGNRLHSVFLENGLLRYNEKEGIMSTVQNNLHFPVTCVDATDQFLSKLKGVVDPESKRKVIGREIINAFDDFAQRLDQELGKRPVFLVQGTLHPDVIESCTSTPGSGTSAHCHKTKSHQNVGGLRRT